MKDKISIQVNECKKAFNVEVTKRNAEADLRGWEEERGYAPSLFLQSLVFCNQFEGSETVLKLKRSLIMHL